jgi:hypothetical protein
MNKQIIILSMFLLIGNLFAKKPDWITGKTKKFPQDKYLIGIGIGKTEEQARNNARAEIAKVFTSHVQSETKDYIESFKKISKKKTEIYGIENIKDTTKITTDKIIAGIIIEEFYKEKDTFYALALLDKIKHTNILSEQISNFDTEILNLLKEGKESLNKIKKIKAYKRAQNKYIERNLLNTELKIVNPVGIGLDPSYNPIEITSNLEKALDDLIIFIKVEGENIENIKKTIESSFTKLGFKLQNDVNIKHDVIINSKIIFDELDHPDKSWEWIKYDANFELLDNSTNSVIGSVTSSGKAAQLTKDSAKEKAKNILKKQIEEEIIIKLSVYIVGN